MRIEEVVFDHDQVVDGVQAALYQRVVPRLLRIRDERGHIGVVDLDADCGRQFARAQHLLDVLALLHGHHVRRGRYSATCSSPESAQVTRLKSTPCSSCRMLRAQTPVVTVYPRFTPTRWPSRSLGVRIPALVLHRMAPW